MSIGTWHPDEPSMELSDAVIERLIAAGDALDAPDLGLSAEEQRRLSALMQVDAARWREVAAARSDDELTTLVRFFTLAEARLPGWEAAERSPVVPIVAELRRRGAYPSSLTRWIRSVSDNRFLPYGSLMDKL